MVFVERRPNAVAVACGMYAALAIVVVAAIVASSNELGQGLVDAAVYGLVGVVLQGARARGARSRCAGPLPGPHRRRASASRSHRHRRDAAGRGRGERRRAVMTATEQAPPPAPRLTGSGSRWRGAAARSGGGVCGMRHRLRTRPADAVGEPARRRDRRDVADRRGIRRRARRGRTAGQTAAAPRGHHVHRRRDRARR